MASISALDRMLDNLENGNIRDAQSQAKSFSLTSIKNYLVESGKSSRAASNTAEYLKGQIDFQSYCDFKHDL